jgi:hypothetical protein
MDNNTKAPRVVSRRPSSYYASNTACLILCSGVLWPLHLQRARSEARLCYNLLKGPTPHTAIAEEHELTALLQRVHLFMLVKDHG